MHKCHRVTLALTDGGTGDGNLSTDGIINNPGGVGNMGSVGAQPIPTLTEWGLLLLSLLAALAAWPALRRLQGE